MEVIAFVGASGTGKSHRAQSVAFDHKCDAILDDGLLIKGAHILAGSSAKNEDNKIQAVKRAIFTDKEHLENMQEVLATSDIKRLLVIATSDNMLERIVERLGLPQPVETVYISQVASKADIKKARYLRLHDGKHIVPVPSVELKQHYSGYFADLPYNIFTSENRHRQDGGRSIVRPAYSFYGRLLIADNAVEDIIKLIAAKDENVAKILAIKVRRRSDNSRGIVITIELVLYYGAVLVPATRKMQAKVKRSIEYMTAMKVNNVNVSVRSLALRR